MQRGTVTSTLSAMPRIRRLQLAGGIGEGAQSPDLCFPACAPLDLPYGLRRLYKAPPSLCSTLFYNGHFFEALCFVFFSGEQAGTLHACGLQGDVENGPSPM